MFRTWGNLKKEPDVWIFWLMVLAPLQVSCSGTGKWSFGCLNFRLWIRSHREVAGTQWSTWPLASFKPFVLLKSDQNICACVFLDVFLKTNDQSLNEWQAKSFSTTHGKLILLFKMSHTPIELEGLIKHCEFKYTLTILLLKKTAIGRDCSP